MSRRALLWLAGLALVVLALLLTGCSGSQA
jgi:hypothetical protein